MKYLRVASLIGVVLFIVGIIIFIISSIMLPRVLVSYEYYHDVYLIALIASLYIGFSFLIRVFFNLYSPRTANVKKKTRNQPNNYFRIAVIGILATLLTGLPTYIGIVSMSAAYFHKNAPKKKVEIEAAVNSAWVTRNLSLDCRYLIKFDHPRISPLIQTVCIKVDQWESFRDVDQPIIATLYGEKSYFGYELSYYK